MWNLQTYYHFKFNVRMLSVMMCYDVISRCSVGVAMLWFGVSVVLMMLQK